MTEKGIEKRPLDHLASAKWPRVKMRRRAGMRAYAAMVGTAPHDTSDVKATDEGRMVRRRRPAMTPMKMMAFLGCPFLSTLPIHLDPGRMPSRAMAKMRRDAAERELVDGDERLRGVDAEQGVEVRRAEEEE